MKEIKGIARVKFLPGKRDEWKRLTEQAMHIVRTSEIAVLACPPDKLRASSCSSAIATPRPRSTSAT
jgi:hypothetical protein